MGLPDIVYLVRDGDDNPELRHSLRSLSNLPHGDVWISGFIPSWVTNVRRVRVRQSFGKWDNQVRNLAAVVGRDGLSERFVLFNDDFFVTEPVQSVPVLHRGPFSKIIGGYSTRRDQYARRICDTAELLGQAAFCYDVIHTPMTFRKELVGNVLEECKTRFLFRSVYGNRAGVGGKETADVKVRNAVSEIARPFCSTAPGMFANHKVGHDLRRQFRTPSPYEC